MASFNKFNILAQDIGRKVHNFHADTLKIMLSNAAPDASNTVKADITEISAGNGYTAGGHAVDNQGFSQTSGVAKLIVDDEVFTASGGSVGPFRYAVLYNDTSTSDSLIGWWDYGSSITLASGETLTVDADATNGVLQVTVS
jgi:hypothetical protein